MEDKVGCVAYSNFLCSKLKSIACNLMFLTVYHEFEVRREYVLFTAIDPYLNDN